MVPYFINGFKSKIFTKPKRKKNVKNIPYLLELNESSAHDLDSIAC